MLEIVNLGTLPTTAVLFGLASVVGSTQVSTPMLNIGPTHGAERRASENARTRRGSTFSFFDVRHRFKELPQNFVEPYREMLAFKSLKDGWDGEGSKETANDSVDAALAFLALLPPDVPAPEASAASDGTVDWYWRKGKNAATVTFYDNRKAAYFALTDAGSAKSAFILADEVPIHLIESLRQL